MHSIYAVEEVSLTSTPQHISFYLLDEEIFIYKAELPYGKLEKQQEFLSWPILNKEEIKKNLLKTLAKEPLIN